MRQFRIKTIAHSLKNNQIGKAKQIVNHDQLTSDAQELIDAGFIEEVFPSQEETKEIDPIDIMTVKELIQFANDNNFTLEEGLKKPEILDSLKLQITSQEETKE